MHLNVFSTYPLCPSLPVLSLFPVKHTTFLAVSTHSKRFQPHALDTISAQPFSDKLAILISSLSRQFRLSLFGEFFNISLVSCFMFQVFLSFQPVFRAFCTLEDPDFIPSHFWKFRVYIWNSAKNRTKICQEEGWRTLTPFSWTNILLYLAYYFSIAFPSCEH